MQPPFTRGFRLHLASGEIAHGAEFPSGKVLVVDDVDWGLCTAAISLEELLKGYHGARVEWPGAQLVPTELLLDLVSIATYPGSFTPPAKPYPPESVRAVLDQLTKYLGYDVAERAAEQHEQRNKEHPDGR